MMRLFICLCVLYVSVTRITLAHAAEGDACKNTYRRTITFEDGHIARKGRSYDGTCQLRTKCKEVSPQYWEASFRGGCEPDYLTCCHDVRGPKTGGATRASRKSQNEESFDLEAKLATIDGLEKVKEELRDLAASSELDAARAKLGIEIPKSAAPHMIFLGNPGTGKTMIGKVLGEMLHAIGVCKENKFIMVRREDLVGSVIGKTEANTVEKIKQAKGGVLFVDEAYQLMRNSEKDFGKEAVEVIMNALHDNDPVFVFAGYPDEMKTFMDANAGMRRRIGRTFLFEDYEPGDISKIFFKFKLHPFSVEGDESAGIRKLSEMIEEQISKEQLSMYNAGIADNLMDFARQALNSRLRRTHRAEEQLTVEQLMTLTFEDISVALRRVAESFASSKSVPDQMVGPGVPPVSQSTDEDVLEDAMLTRLAQKIVALGERERPVQTARRSRPRQLPRPPQDSPLLRGEQ